MGLLPKLVLRTSAAALLLACTELAQAGLYNTSEPDEGKLPSRDKSLGQRFLEFRDTLFRLRSIGMDSIQIDNEIRRRYLLAELAAQVPTAKLSVEQKLNLGAILLRRKKHDAALEI